MVTGLVALMNQNDRIKNDGFSTIRHFDVRDWVRSSAIRDDFTGAVMSHLWGSGKLDALGAMEQNTPKAPVLTITDVSKTSIELSWTVDPPATSILIERRVDETPIEGEANGDFEPYQTVQGTNTFTDVNVIKDVFYGYRITAYFGQLASEVSNAEGAVAKSGGGGGGGCFISTVFP